MPVARQSHYLTLEDANSANTVGLMLRRQEDGSLAYGWRLLPEKRIEQRNWWNGALQFYYDPNMPDLYGLADGVWAATANELSLGPKIVPHTVGVKNGGAELNNTNAWTATGITLTVITTAPYNGVYHFQCAAADANDLIGQELSLGDDGATDIASRFSSKASLKVTAWARIPAGQTATVRLNLVETSGASGTTNGTAVALTTTYQQLSVTRSLGANVTDLTLQVEVTVGTTATFYVDEITIDDAADDTVQIQNPFFEMASNLGLVTKTGVWLWGETNDYWELQKWHGSNITGHRVWDNRLFCALGASTAYQYSDAGSLTAWTASTLTDNKAQFLAVGRSLDASTMAFHKTLDPDSLKLNTDPTNGSTQWGSQVEVGANDRSITGIYELFGHVYIAKEDGLYVYGRDFETNLLGTVNLAQGLQFVVGKTNFSRGAYHQGWFYTTIGETGLWRFNGNVWDNLTRVITTPAFSEFGEKVTSIGSDGNWLYITLDDNGTDNADKNSWIVMLREHPEGWEVHTLAKIKAAQSYGWASLSNTTSEFVYLAVDLAEEFVTYRIQRGAKADTPRRALNNAMALTGTLILSYFSFPQREKLNRLSLYSELLSANLSVTVHYELNDDTSWTIINATDGTFNTSPSETIAFGTSATPYRVRLRFTLDSNGNTSTPVIKGYTLHLTRKKEWVLDAALEDDMVALQGVKNALPAGKMISQLDTLRGSVDEAPLRFTDIDGTLQRVVISDMQEVNFQVHQSTPGVPVYARALRLTLTEAFA